MRGLLADYNVTGHLRALVTACRHPDWRELWDSFEIGAWTFADFALDSAMRDTALWKFCQREQLILITANRNADSHDSLTVAIAELGTLECLPVFTLADGGRILTDREYCRRCAIRVMELILDLNRIRGSGRVFIP
jgi:hypothetical protein